MADKNYEFKVDDIITNYGDHLGFLGVSVTLSISKESDAFVLIFFYIVFF